MSTVQKLLSLNKDMHVIDLGANIGQYSLLAAHAGRKVLSVEARLLHIHMLYHSLQLNNFLDRVTLMHNAISDSRANILLRSYDKNPGGTYVLEGDELPVDQSNSGGHVVDVRTNMSSTSILMDDLADVVNFSKALLKMDIEGSEHRALKYSDRLFNKVYIPFIFMEWAAMREKRAREIEPLLKKMSERRYQVYSMNCLGQAYDMAKWREWGGDVIFKHVDAKFN